MKTYKNLYAQVYDFANLYGACRRARLGKRDRATVDAFEFDLEQNLLALQEELHNHTYKPGAYTNFYIHEPGRRCGGPWGCVVHVRCLPPDGAAGHECAG